MNALFTYVTLFILDGFTYDKLRYLWYEKDSVIVLHDNLPLYDTVCLICSKDKMSRNSNMSSSCGLYSSEVAEIQV